MLAYDACQGISNASSVLQTTVFSSSYTENWVPVVLILLSLVAPLVVMTTVCGAASDDKVIAMTTCGIQCANQQSLEVFMMSWE